MSDTDKQMTERPAPPPLEHRSPLCSLCGEETTDVGSCFTCPDCDASWPGEDYYLHSGEWDHGSEAEQCQSTVTGPRQVHRCWLTTDHLGDHRNPDGSWDDAEADTAATSGSAA